MTFAGGQPLFIRRSGVWHGLLWNQVRSTMVARYGKVGAQIFGVALILTISSKGGILVFMDRPSDHLDLNEKDRVDRARKRGPTSRSTAAHRRRERIRKAGPFLRSGTFTDCCRPATLRS